MASNDKVMTTADLAGEGTKPAAAPRTDVAEAMLPYVAAQTVAINNRNIVMYLVEGESVELTEGEAQVLISLGYVVAPEPPEPEPDPDKRKGVKPEPETPESKTAKAETR